MLNYRIVDSCANCKHCELIKNQDYTQSYCNINKDSPPKVNYRENDPNEDKIWEKRIEWEVENRVELIGFCDLWEDNNGNLNETQE